MEESPERSINLLTITEFHTIRVKLRLLLTQLTLNVKAPGFVKIAKVLQVLKMVAKLELQNKCLRLLMERYQELTT